VEESVRALAICSQGTVERGERLAEFSRDTLHASRVSRAPVNYLQRFVTEGVEGELGGKIGEIHLFKQGDRLQ